jgi:hypothetical protein
MKNISLLISFLFLSFSSLLLNAQAPQKMTFQSVVRNSNNQLVSNAPVAFKTSVLQGSSTGTAVFIETHTATTNTNGLATLQIGGGTPITGTFASINWANGPYFIKTECDPSGGTNYTLVTTTQLLSVPYALYAETSGTPGPQGPQGVAGPTGNAGADGKNTLAKTTTEAAGANCITGGVKVEYGLDANNNSILDLSEIDASVTKYICNGAVGAIGATGAQGPAGSNGTNGTNGIDGKNTLAKTTTEAAGANCITGGVKVEYGLDANINGLLDAGEVNASLTIYICNGALGATGNTGQAGTNGTNGSNGADGNNTLVKTTSEAAGVNCATGGTKVEVGLDTNVNGVLDAAEVNTSLTKYICDGANGKNTLVNTTSEPAGANCATGGTKIEVGLDANANGVLDAGEIDATLTKYVCNGATTGTQIISINGNTTSQYIADYLFDTGNCTDGTLSTTGNYTLNNTFVQYCNLKINSGHTLFLGPKNGAKTYTILADTVFIAGTIDGYNNNNSGSNFTTVANLSSAGGAGGKGRSYGPSSSGGWFPSNGQGFDITYNTFNSGVSLTPPIYSAIISDGNYNGGNSTSTILSYSSNVRTDLFGGNGTCGGYTTCTGCTPCFGAPYLPYNGAGEGGDGLYIICNVFLFSGTIDLRGENGYAQTAVTSGNSSSGAGGGGSLIISTKEILNNSGTILTNGGLASPATNCSPAGGNGGNGAYIIINH